MYTKTDKVCAQASQLYTRMVTQGGDKTSILRQTKKSFQKYPETLSKHCKTHDELINEIIIYYHLNLTKNVCMYVCMYVCLCVCVFVCVCLYMYNIYIYIYIYIRSMK